MTVKRAFLVAVAKNEAPYFLEWVAHHLEVGFTDIVIFQNDSDDLTHETLAALRDIGAIKYYYNRAGNGRHQVRAYERSGTLDEYKTADWAMALDMDEFLVVKTGDGRLDDLIAAVPESDVFHLNWRIFGNSGHEVLTEDLVTERFTMANYQLGRDDHFGAHKSLFRPAQFSRVGIHRPYKCHVDPEILHYRNGSGLKTGDYEIKNYNSTDPGGCKFAQINHYIVRDMASFMLKSERGSAHQANRPIAHRYWTMRNTNFEPDSSMAPFTARVKARMAALDEASGGRLAELRQKAVFTHLARYYTLLQDKQNLEFRAFLFANPNAIDHRKLKDQRAKETAAKTALKAAKVATGKAPGAAPKTVALLKSKTKAATPPGKTRQSAAAKTTKLLRKLAGT